MTQNQIAYWNLQEAKRSNLAKEAETNRSNLAKEAETARHNVIGENIDAAEMQSKIAVNEQDIKTKRASAEKALYDKYGKFLGPILAGVDTFKYAIGDAAEKDLATNRANGTLNPALESFLVGMSSNKETTIERNRA